MSCWHMVIQSICLVAALVIQEATFTSSRLTKISGVLSNQSQYSRLAVIMVWWTAFRMTSKQDHIKPLQVGSVMPARSWRIVYTFSEDTMEFSASTISITMSYQNRKIQNFRNRRSSVIWNPGSTTKTMPTLPLFWNQTTSRFMHTNWSSADAPISLLCSKRHLYTRRWTKLELNLNLKK